MGWNAHQSAGSGRTLIGSVPHFAPESIHSFSVAFSSAVSGFFGGILSASTRFHSSDTAGATTAFRVMSKSPFGFSPLWHPEHRFTNKGATVASKSGVAATAVEARHNNAKRARGM